MATRIALTLAGGVSLGTYQAGAVYELLRALGQQPAGPDRTTIDVITGASAGSLTGAVVARVLMHDRQIAGELKNAWVTEIDFDSLTAEQAETSLLSDRRVRALAARIFGLADAGGGMSPPAPARHPAAPARHPAAPARLTMAFALSNLNGVNYRLGYPGGASGLETTVFSDWIVFTLGATPDGARTDSGDQWRQIAHAAIASGAVPVAFPTVRVPRQPADYRGSEIADLKGPLGFTYVDGGLFNNEPVGLAREIVEQLQASDPTIERDRRIYLLIDPFVASSLAEPEYAEEPLGYRRLLWRLISVIMGEASKRDWIRATRVNQRLEWQEKLLENLGEIVAALPPPDLERCAIGARRLAGEIAGFKLAYEAAGRPLPPDATRRHLAATLKRWGPMAAEAHAPDPRRCEAFLDLAYALENAAGLRKKANLELHVIAPQRGSLAGDFLGNFGGFFNKDWREHDWRRGRADARDFIVHRLGAYDQDDPCEYTPSVDLSGVSERDIPDGASAGLRRIVQGGIASFLSATRGGWLKRALVGAFSWILAALAVRLLMKRRSSCT